MGKNLNVTYLKIYYNSRDHTSEVLVCDLKFMKIIRDQNKFILCYKVFILYVKTDS